MTRRSIVVPIWAVAQLTLRDALRQRLVAIVVVLASALVLGSQLLQEFNFGESELKFIADLGFGAVEAGGAILAIALTVQLLHREFEERTVLTLLARPLGRTGFLLGKFAGASGLIVAYSAAMTGLLTLVLWRKEAAIVLGMGASEPVRLLNYGWIMALGGWLTVKLVVLGAATFAVSCYTRSAWVALLAGASVYVAGHLQDLAGRVAEHSGALVHRLAGAAAGWFFPDFQLFTPDSAASVAGRLGYAAAYVLAVILLGAACFDRREF